MSLHQLDTASMTEGGLGRRVMARSCPARGRKTLTHSPFLAGTFKFRRVSHLPPLDLRLRGLTGTAGAAGLLLQQLGVGLLAGWWRGDKEDNDVRGGRRRRRKGGGRSCNGGSQVQDEDATPNGSAAAPLLR